MNEQMPQPKHADRLARALSDSEGARILREFPAADPVTPRDLLKLAQECHPDYSPNSRSYRDGAIIKDLVYSLMEEWGWTKERRNG